MDHCNPAVEVGEAIALHGSLTAGMIPSPLTAAVPEGETVVGMAVPILRLTEEVEVSRQRTAMATFLGLRWAFRKCL